MATKLIVMIAGMVSLTSSKPIMVSFGTKQGPIVPAAPTSTTANPLAPRNAAPVFENTNEDDDTNAPRYQPLTPHQYRNDVYSRRPNPNLILGTPVDVKYSASQEKIDLYNRKAKYAQSVGLGYTGPQAFDVQDYEIERARRKLRKQEADRKYYVQQYRNQAAQKRVDKRNYNFDQQPQEQKYVPQIGIVYSSGVRYYIPQIVYYQNSENSVYDNNDVKYQQY